MDLAVIGVVIDPTGAESGSARARAAATAMQQNFVSVTQNINASNTSLTQSHANVGASMTRLGGQADDLVRRLAQLALSAAGVKNALDLVGTSVAAASQYEQMTFRITTLTGSLAAARGEMDLFQQFANRTQFKLPDVTQAAAYAHLFDPSIQGAQAMQRELTILADAASTAQQPIGQVAFLYERLKSEVAEGGQIGQASRGLEHMGVLTTAVVTQLRNADKWGLDAGQKIAILEAGMQRTSGATERAQNLFETQKTTLADTWQQVERTFGTPIIDSLKPSLANFTTVLHDDILPLSKSVGDEIGHWIDRLNGAQRAGQFSLGATGVAGNILGSLASVGADSNPLGMGGALAKAVGDAGDYTRESAKAFYALVVEGGERAGALLQASGAYLFERARNLLADAHVPGISASTPHDFGELNDLYLKNIRYHDGTTDTTYSDQITRADAAGRKFWDDLTKLGDGLNSLGGTVKKFDATFQEGFERGMGRGLNINGYTGGYGAGAGGPLDGYTRGERSYVFGLNMDGGVDRTDEGRMSFYNAHHGAYNGTDLLNPNLLGAAVGPDQASALTGISDGVRAQTALLGKYLEIQYGTQSTLVQIVDKAPNGHQGIELTPAAHRAVGDAQGDAAIAYRLPSDQRLGELLKAQYQVAGEVRQAGTVSPLEMAMEHTGALKFTPDNGAVKTYLDTLTQLQYGLERVDSNTGKTMISTREYTERLFDAQDKLAKNVSTYGALEQALREGQSRIVDTGDAFLSLAQKINQASVEQAKYNQDHAQMQRLVNLGVATPGQAIGFGASSWAHGQGTQDEQLAKLTGGSLDALTNDTANLFDTMESGSARGAAAFKTFASSLLGDIGKLIIRMELLALVQKAVGFIGGLGGGDGLTSYGASQGFTGGTASLGAAVGHSGAMIGGMATGFRAVDPSLFYGAPRHHGGGMLGYDEVPFIGLRGERVLNRQETAAYNGGGGGGSVNYSPTWNVGTDQSTGKPALDPAAIKRVDDRTRAMIREELINANRYRGINNP